MKTRMASALAAASLAGVAVVASGAPAAAVVPYTPSDTPPGSIISDGTVVPGQIVRALAGPGSFAPGSAVRINIPGMRVAATTAAARADGSAAFEFRVPGGTAPGRYEVVFVGPSSPDASVQGASFSASGGDISGTTTAAAQGATNTVRVPFTVVASGAGDDSDDGGDSGGGGGNGAGNGAGNGNGAGAGNGNGNGAGNGSGGGSGNDNGGRWANNSALPFTGSQDLVPLTIAGFTLVGVGAVVVVASRRREHVSD